MMKEICICAAVICTDGTIIRGHRHRDCFDTIIRKGKKIHQNFDSQGFITSYNKYVTREEGYKLQIKAKIKSANSEGYNKAKLLFSEDLY
jgi:hypothetical protein